MNPRTSKHKIKTPPIAIDTNDEYIQDCLNKYEDDEYLSKEDVNKVLDKFSEMPEPFKNLIKGGYIRMYHTYFT